MKEFIVFITVVVLLLTVFVSVFVFIGKGIDKSVEQVKKSYLTPDTAISIHNGKPDTVITKKTLPFWAK